MKPMEPLLAAAAAAKKNADSARRVVTRCASLPLRDARVRAVAAAGVVGAHPHNYAPSLIVSAVKSSTTIFSKKAKRYWSLIQMQAEYEPPSVALSGAPEESMHVLTAERIAR